MCRLFSWETMAFPLFFSTFTLGVITSKYRIAHNRIQQILDWTDLKSVTHQVQSFTTSLTMPSWDFIILSILCIALLQLYQMISNYIMCYHMLSCFIILHHIFIAVYHDHLKRILCCHDVLTAPGAAAPKEKKARILTARMKRAGIHSLEELKARLDAHGEAKMRSLGRTTTTKEGVLEMMMWRKMLWKKNMYVCRYRSNQTTRY